MYWRVARSLVRTMDMPQQSLSISLLVVRWWEYWSMKGERMRSHNVANPEMLKDILEAPCTPHAVFGPKGQYEVHTAFVRGSEDLDDIVPAFHRAAASGRSVSAYYFLWPTTVSAYERRMPGSIAEPKLLKLMADFEAINVRTCWPHPLKLYRELAGKFWAPRVCRTRPDLRVPATVFLDHNLWGVDKMATAESIITQLKELQNSVQPRVQKSSTPFRGVAKLGFSWMAMDVCPFEGVDELVRVLSQLLDVAQPGANCIVQERIEHVTCELRVMCFRDLAKGASAVQRELVRMQMNPPRHQNDPTFCAASAMILKAQDATKLCFSGNEEALQKAESEVMQLSDLWLEWFRSEGYGLPSVVRLDFMVSVPPDGPPAVWSVELCECGGALCGLRTEARTVAVLNQCLEGGPPVEGFPLPLPHTRPASDYMRGVVSTPSAPPSGAASNSHVLRGGSALGAAVARGADHTAAPVETKPLLKRLRDALPASRRRLAVGVVMLLLLTWLRIPALRALLGLVRGRPRRSRG
eukprot:NODE_2440_length_2212_cov_5.006235.p1 GENE.NODE_2440_length_2212_cov_5.006235~~NODE_2440_length_2212_cov_5.006235.p1  ORF type:complete len:524 (+),score=106.90 NODE_2440_length_2212_cov_5.006235:205-1776(+)